jgi:hypothetical protein
MCQSSSHFPAAVAVLVAVCLATAAAQGPRIVAIRTTPEQRKAYLAHAVIWHEPAVLSPDDLLHGQAGEFPYSFEQAIEGEGVGCTFKAPGTTLGGKSPKFLCVADDNRALRLKYWDPKTGEGNREVFAAVAAVRLMGALGFAVVPVMPINIRCKSCPANPMTGEGARADRNYVALLQTEFSRPVIVSSGDDDQGWSWKELSDAIAALPPGEERIRQRTHLDALALFGVLVQHGDRKPEQQALFCDGQLSPEAGTLNAVKDKQGVALLTERKGASACARASVAIVDVGSSFGGAGRLSKQGTAKMNLEQWASKPVFKDTGTVECRGNLIVSLAAGDEGNADPVISEEGRQFLLDRLQRLTPDHLRALFKAARVDRLGPGGKPRADNEAGDPLQAWVNAFQNKVKQIESRRCRSLTSRG